MSKQMNGLKRPSVFSRLSFATPAKSAKLQKASVTVNVNTNTQKVIEQLVANSKKMIGCIAHFGLASCPSNGAIVLLLRLDGLESSSLA